MYLWAVSKYFWSLDNCRFRGTEGRNVYLGRDSCTATLQLEGNKIKITGMPQRCRVGDVLHMQMSRKWKVVGIFSKKLSAFYFEALTLHACPSVEWWFVCKFTIFLFLENGERSSRRSYPCRISFWLLRERDITQWIETKPEFASPLTCGCDSDILFLSVLKKVVCQVIINCGNKQLSCRT